MEFTASEKNYTDFAVNGEVDLALDPIEKN